MKKALFCVSNKNCWESSGAPVYYRGKALVRGAFCNTPVTQNASHPTFCTWTMKFFK